MAAGDDRLVNGPLCLSLARHCCERLDVAAPGKMRQSVQEGADIAERDTTAAARTITEPACRAAEQSHRNASEH
jgi:hypothetical protein